MGTGGGGRTSVCVDVTVRFTASRAKLLGRAIVAVTCGDRSVALLSAMTDGRCPIELWDSGPCDDFAAGLSRWMGSAAERLVLARDEYLDKHGHRSIAWAHVVVSLRGWHFDSTGTAAPRVMLQRWRAYATRIVPYDTELVRDMLRMCPSVGDNPARLRDLFHDELGPIADWLPDGVHDSDLIARTARIEGSSLRFTRARIREDNALAARLYAQMKVTPVRDSRMTADRYNAMRRVGVMRYNLKRLKSLAKTNRTQATRRKSQ